LYEFLAKLDLYARGGGKAPDQQLIGAAEARRALLPESQCDQRVEFDRSSGKVVVGVAVHCTHGSLLIFCTRRKYLTQVVTGARFGNYLSGDHHRLVITYVVHLAVVFRIFERPLMQVQMPFTSVLVAEGYFRETVSLTPHGERQQCAYTRHSTVKNLSPETVIQSREPNMEFDQRNRWKLAQHDRVPAGPMSVSQDGARRTNTKRRECGDRRAALRAGRFGLFCQTARPPFFVDRTSSIGRSG
jgi:hypothetical protein